MRRSSQLVLTDEDFAELGAWAEGRKDRVVRLGIVHDAAAGLSVSQSARRLGVSRPTVTAWRRRYAAQAWPGWNTGRAADARRVSTRPTSSPRRSPVRPRPGAPGRPARSPTTWGSRTPRWARCGSAGGSGPVPVTCPCCCRSTRPCHAGARSCSRRGRRRRARPSW
ncbi:helix-turn-helix domain-containing protein [Streptomyces sp. MMS24-I2-30]|uniref:helix-turn-helix domain-containing protein n=1 Tax=Streptomyces sp. MMS24-I2-30 TaxID=3351564 RepID=UPI00389695D5